MQTDPATRRLGLILLSLYLLSGASSLAYEILWTRMLSLQFGVSIFGVVATVTAYMAGLGIGSFFGVRWSLRTRHPLRLFALLELSVAGAALIIPVLFQALDAQFAILAGDMAFSGWLALQVVVVTLVLMIPALGMGAGFPLVLRAVQNTRVSFAGIYGINALGGALGALLPLWLLPHLGWLSSLRAVAVLGLVVGLVALWMSRQRAVDAAPPNSALLRPSWGWVFAYAGIGAGALILEIGWTRLYGMVMLRTEYVLAIILAVFLVGIGAGSLISRYLSQRFWFSVLPVIAGGFAILSLWLLPTLASWVEQTRFDSLSTALVSQASAVVSMTLPVTLVLGAWLPLLAARLGNRYQSGVWLYGANSLGAAAGAMLAGFILIPAFGTSTTIVLGAMLLLALGAVLARGWSPVRPVWAAFVLLGLLATPVLDMPPVSALMPLAYGQTRLLSLHEDAISITHVVEGPDGQRQLLADLRRMDASSDPTAVAVQMNQVRLPLMLHPEPRQALFLGLGTGISASAALAYPELTRTAVELSLGAIEAAGNEFRAVNGAITEHANIVRDDARHFLLSDRKYYDVIIGDLFHPDLVGRSALLSRQQFQRARQRLAPGGIFVQWLALNQFDVDNLKVVMATFRDIFPQAILFLDGFRLALVGSNGGTINADNVLSNLQTLAPDRAAAATGGEGPWTWLGRYWGRIPELDVPLQDEWAPVIEYALPSARFNGELDLARVLSWLVTQRPGLKQAARELAVSEPQFTQFERAYAATELAHRSWLALLAGRDQEGRRLLPLAYQANPLDRWVGFALADAVLLDRDAARARGLDEQALLESVLKIRPDHTEALHGLWQLAQARGEKKLAAYYRERFARLSPLDATLRTGTVEN